MGNVTVNISFQAGLLKEIDAVAERESRSRSELIREAARAYVTRKKNFEALFALGNRIAKERKLTPADVEREIQAVRRLRRKTG